MKIAHIYKLLFFLLTSFLLAQDIDWINKTITVEGAAYGKNKLLAKRGAKTDARRNLIEAIKEIRIDSKTTMRDLEVEEDLVISEASGYIKQAWFDDNSIEYEREGEKWICTISVTMPLLGEYSDVIIPKSMTGKSSSITSTPSVTTTSPAAVTKYTGLVIDLKGQRVVPSMSPIIVTKEGAEVYGMRKVSREYAVSMGVVGYIKDLKTMQANMRIGENPLIIKAIDVAGASPCNAVVNDSDVGLIKSIGQPLEECRVAFLID